MSRPQFLPRADVIVVMLEGRIAHVGSYQQLISQGIDLAAIVPVPHDADEDQEEQLPGQQLPGQQLPTQQLQGAQVSPAAAAASSTIGSLQQQQLQQGRGQLETVEEDGETVVSSAAARQLPPFERSQPSVPHIIELPQSLTRSLLVGGSFASHKPSKLGDHLAGGGAGAGAGCGGAAGAVAAADGDAERVVVDVGGDGGKAGAAGGVMKAVVEEEGLVKEEQGEKQGGGGGEAGGLLRRGRLILAEHRAKGQVKRSVYLAYLGAWGPFFLLPILIGIGERCPC